MTMAALVMPGAALAHASIDVGDGQYVMEVGFRDEPTYLGLPNALYLKVEEYATGGAKPVDGLAASLTTEVDKDGQTLTLPLVPLGDGEYQMTFVPTATGDYTFRISGTIGEALVDASVTSGPNTFNSVEPLSAIEFPVARQDPGQIALAASNAEAAAASARTFAIVGIAIGVLGLIVAAAALTRSGRKAPTVAREIEPTGKLVR